MNKPTCKDCNFLQGRQCCRYPPQVVEDTARDDKNTMFPFINPDHDWCGEFQPIPLPKTSLEAENGRERENPTESRAQTTEAKLRTAAWKVFERFLRPSQATEESGDA